MYNNLIIKNITNYCDIFCNNYYIFYCNKYIFNKNLIFKLIIKDKYILIFIVIFCHIRACKTFIIKEL